MKARTRNVSMDAAFKALLRNLDIPSKKDMDKLNAKIDRLEKMIKKTAAAQPAKAGKLQKKQNAQSSASRRQSATGVVLDAIKRSKKGADFATLQTKTGFDEKKLRNIIFRLNKLGKIKRVDRGLYGAA